MWRAVATAARRSILSGGVVLGLAAPGVAAQVFPYGSEYPWEVHASVLLPEPGRMLPKLSTLGQGFEYRYSYSPRFGLRTEAFDYQEGREDVDSLLRTDLQLKMRSSSLLFDWFPFNGRFRATTGIYVNRIELSGTASYDDWRFPGLAISTEQVNRWAQETARRLNQTGYREYALEIERFAAANEESLHVESRTVTLRDAVAGSGRVRPQPYAPYLGFGWANVDERHLGLFYSIDLGLLDLGQLEVELSLSGSVVDALRPYYGSELDAWLAEQEREAERKLSKFRYYPVISVGVGYRF